MRTLSFSSAFASTLAVALALAICLTPSTLVAQSMGLADLVDPSTEATRVATGFKFTEGPAFGPQGRLLFSDIPNSRIVEIGSDGSPSDFLQPSGRANGLMFDREGYLYACQGGARRLVRIDLEAKASPVVLAETFDGKKLNSPNDLALDAHGGIYFTDPRYGGDEPVEQPVMGVYYIDKAGKIQRVIDKLERPNGILVSPDGKALYVAEPNKRELYRYAIEAPGKLGEGSLIFTGDATLDGGGPDGMAHDKHGNLYCTYKGITVLDPDGKLIGRIPVPEHPANCTFGDKDGKTLYVTARTSLYKIAMKVSGAPLRSRSSGASAVKFNTLSLEVPAGWKAQKPRNTMRLGQYVVPAVAGDSVDGEFVVFYFGQRGAGGVAANVERWVNQFAADGRKHTGYTGKSEQGTYTVVDISGTYRKSVGPPIRRQTEDMPGFRVVNVMLETAKGSYFLKLEGPQKTVAANIEGLRNSFGADAAGEKKLP